MTKRAWVVFNKRMINANEITFVEKDNDKLTFHFKNGRETTFVDYDLDLLELAKKVNEYPVVNGTHQEKKLPNHKYKKYQKRRK